MVSFYRGVLALFILFIYLFYLLKQVPSYCTFLGECCMSVLLLSSGNVLQKPNLIFHWYDNDFSFLGEFITYSNHFYD